MEALHDVVRPARRATSAPRRCGRGSSRRRSTRPTCNGWTPFVSMQDQYNLLQREEEREMHPFCLDQGVGVIPWSPLARGSLTRDWDEETARTETDGSAKTLYQHEESTARIVEPSRASPPSAASPAPRSRSPGCCSSRRSPRRSSERRTPSTSTTRSPRPASAWNEPSSLSLESAYTPREAEGF